MTMTVDLTTAVSLHGSVQVGADAGTFYRRVDMFCTGRDGTNDHRNEDCLVLEPTPWGTVMAAIDGITAQTTALFESRTFGGYDDVTSGWLGAHIAARHIKALRPGMTLLRLVRAIWRDWLKVRQRPDFPDGEIIGAVFTVLVPWEGEHGAIWTFGDPLWGYRTDSATGDWVDSMGGRKLTSSKDALVRKAAIETAMGKRGLTLKEVLANRDLRGEMTRLGRQAMMDQRKSRNGGVWIEAWEYVRKQIHKVEMLPANVWLVVLASDGLLNVPRAMDVGLAALDYRRREDPLMIGIKTDGEDTHDGLATAKGFVADNGDILPFTDDVCAIVALR